MDEVVRFFADDPPRFPESQVTVVALSNLPSGESSEKQPPIIVLSDWLGILAHGGTVTLPAKR